MRKWAIPTLTLALLLTLSPLTWAQTPRPTPSPHVYRIVASQCAGQPPERTQTGFRVKDRALVGIVTALHGVAGCKAIAAVPANLAALDNLIIAKVDIAHDVALLWSEQVDDLQLDGLVPEDLSSKNIYDGLTVIGYHSGLSTQPPPEALKLREETQLVDLVPDALYPALINRRSPALDIEALSIDGNLLPGHSGAPILNRNGRLVGVGDGGIDFGRVGWGWAIPWHEIEWKTVVATTPKERVSRADVVSLQALATTDAQLVFSFSDPAAATPTPKPKPTRRPQTVKVVGAGNVRDIGLIAPNLGAE